ncbi:MAG: DUF4093 domain-containing protein [Ruminococcaceae bacterium]|nr:DUF4093 domain-containing protein [Oscillospiraceae bacterium]
MIRLDIPVIVEGKYDKITLENIIDATIIPTNGFGIFKDKQKCELIRTLSLQKGVIIMTDSDNAGLMIRNRLKQICAGGKIINVYVPEILGKEKRKTAPSKQGLLGVEGMDSQIILSALERSGVNAQINTCCGEKITKTDLFCLGFSGGQNSSEYRKSFASFLKLPTNISSNAFLDVLNTLFTKEEFNERVILWRQEWDKK